MNFCSECGTPLENGKCPKCSAPDDLQPNIPPVPAAESPNTYFVANGQPAPAPINNKMKICKHCGAQIAKSAKKCPHCGGKNKKPIYKRVWFWILAVIVVITIIGKFSNNDEQAEPAEKAAVKEVIVTAEPTAIPIETPAEIATEEEEAELSIEEIATETETEVVAAVADENALTPEWKEWLDSYEAFMNEYCDFMEAYDADSLDLNAMLEYTAMLTEFAEFTEQIDEVDESELSLADYNYYIDVTARVEKRLLEVSYAIG